MTTTTTTTTLAARDAFLAAINAAPQDPAPRLMFTDWLTEQGCADLAKRLAAPVACDFHQHVTVLVKTAAENVYYRDCSVVAFSPELTAAIWAMRNVGNCNLFHCGPSARNYLSTSRQDVPLYTPEMWAAQVAEWSLRHAQTDASWIGSEGLASHRDCCAYLGQAAAAAEIDALIPAAVGREFARRAKLAERTQQKDAADRDAAEKVVAWFGSEAWTLDRARNAKGYDARLAERLLSGPESPTVVIISHDAPTRRGLRLVSGKSSVLYYRKSACGKWGRSSQQRYVTLPE